MRLQITKSKNAECFYVVQSVRVNGKNSNRVVERLGNLEEVKLKADGSDPYAWAKNYAASLTLQESDQTRKIQIELSQSEQIPSGEQRLFNGGYLFLQELYYRLGLNVIAKALARKHKFEYNLNAILSRLAYCRIIAPLSKLGTFEFSQELLEPPDFDLHHMYRALDIIAEENDYIQERLYKNSMRVCQRNTNVLYYDCTNFFFEIEEEKGCRKYGHSKENRPLPIVEMGLFMDGSGIPLAFSIWDGNKNEQSTMRPLEEKILHDFGLSSFTVCTDAGLSSATNRFFNSHGKRNYLTAVSLKTMSEERGSKFMTPTGWKLPGNKTTYDINEIEKNPELRKKYYNSIFYKEEWFIDTVDCEDDLLGKKVKRDLHQRLVVTFSLKYKDYLSAVRGRQIERAQKMVKNGGSRLKKNSQNDCKRFVGSVSTTSDGEIAEKTQYYLDESSIQREAKFDGYYGMYTNLSNQAFPIEEILRIAHGRWEIEECFRIMKSEFDARPVYLQKDNRIKAHFTTCFIALLILRLLEQKLDYKYTYGQIIDCLRTMNFCKIQEKGIIPTYKRTKLTDSLHAAFNFHTDYEIISPLQMKKIFAQTKNPSIL